MMRQLRPHQAGQSRRDGSLARSGWGNHQLMPSGTCKDTFLLGVANHRPGIERSDIGVQPSDVQLTRSNRTLAKRSGTPSRFTITSAASLPGLAPFMSNTSV